VVGIADELRMNEQIKAGFCRKFLIAFLACSLRKPAPAVVPAVIRPASIAHAPTVNAVREQARVVRELDRLRTRRPYLRDARSTVVEVFFHFLAGATFM